MPVSTATPWATVLATVTLLTSALASLQDCLNEVCAGRSDCVAFADDGLDVFNTYQSNWVKPYNLAVHVSPAAVIRPKSSDEVASIVKCAVENDSKVQAKSGGHSYANFGLGDGAVAIDLVNINDYSFDNTTGYAKIGAGLRLGEIDAYLHKTGRAFAHGVCPSVGIGGHATIGGLGPMSRMWGPALDHIVEVEVVTANGTIVRANEDENNDLFLALRGAGASFGVITEFVMRTHPEPGNVIQYTFDITIADNPARLTDVYMQWQTLVLDPSLDRRFGTELITWLGGIIITGTFYGTEDEFQETGITQRLPGNGTIEVADWLGSLAALAEKETLYLATVSSNFYAKSLGFRREDALSKESAIDLFEYAQGLDKGTLLWFIIFDAAGGAVADVPSNATAYAHRDKYMFYQSYAVDLLDLSDTTVTFLNDFHEELVGMLPNNTMTRGTYPGYVDLNISGIPQKQYWGENLSRLERIKSAWDPKDIFHNPQSVRGLEDKMV
ncbi:FAD binding domain-containing protein [Diaporthe helianthi]|uniref:FAD binding domain-containing protein n=1 Tax=Diaporthe helianthi TaxID=158607 RepID=A0A2P5HEH7_DIAHE|nr:FAD binding domain-containing protein [Diaporthe helianthi]